MTDTDLMAAVMAFLQAYDGGTRKEQAEAVTRLRQAAARIGVGRGRV